MTNRIAWRPEAKSDVQGILDYLDFHSATAGDRFITALHAGLNLLIELPFLGSLYPNDVPRFSRLRVWQVQGFDDYLVFYQPFRDGSGIDIIRILHGARDLSAIFK